MQKKKKERRYKSLSFLGSLAAILVLAAVVGPVSPVASKVFGREVAPAGKDDHAREPVDLEAKSKNKKKSRELYMGCTCGMDKKANKSKLPDEVCDKEVDGLFLERC